MANERLEFNSKVIDEFRANGGKVGGPFQGASLLLLTTTGAKSGQPRTSPLVYTTDGERIVIIASMAGAPTNPAWYHNLAANRHATVELGTETIAVHATDAEGAERHRLYDAQAEIMPAFKEYATKTTRVIPVVLLDRV
jgi:deazaflavin-dependent oxidoreductase (nitroreductase family)